MCALVILFCFVVGIFLVLSDDVRAFLRELFDFKSISSIFIKESKIDASREASVCYQELKNVLSNGKVDSKPISVHFENNFNDIMTHVYSIRDPSEISRNNTSYFNVWKIRFNDSDYSLSYLTSSVKKHISDEINKHFGFDVLPYYVDSALEAIIKKINDNGVLGVENSYEKFHYADSYGRQTGVVVFGQKRYNVISGIIGLKRLSGSEDLLISIGFSNDKWIEKNAINLSVSSERKIWNNKNLIDFTSYLLIEELNKNMKVEKEKMIDLVIKDNGFELYQWLNSIGYIEYYKLFKHAGYEKERTIATIDENTLMDIGIPKQGHVQDLKIYINELNMKLTANERW